MEAVKIVYLVKFIYGDGQNCPFVKSIYGGGQKCPSRLKDPRPINISLQTLTIKGNPLSPLLHLSLSPILHLSATA
jgi:hypothetical protein